MGESGPDPWWRKFLAGIGEAGFTELFQIAIAVIIGAVAVVVYNVLT